MGQDRLASIALGPVGWLYAGSFREAIPAAAAWLAFGALASQVPPDVPAVPGLMLVALPLSGIAGVVYALQYNRHGKRQRLFGEKRQEAAPRWVVLGGLTDSLTVTRDRLVIVDRSSRYDEATVARSAGSRSLRSRDVAARRDESRSRSFPASRSTSTPRAWMR